MRYEEFIGEVSRRSGTGATHSKAASRAVVRALAEQAGCDAMSPVAALLPEELRNVAQAPGPRMAASPLDGFLRRIAEREATGLAVAERDARVVIAVLGDDDAGKRLGELFSRLPAEYRRFHPAGARQARAVRPPPPSEVPGRPLGPLGPDGGQAKAGTGAAVSRADSGSTLRGPAFCRQHAVRTARRAGMCIYRSRGSR
jgi:uncharacterized protein (DUF2267 family)